MFKPAGPQAMPSHAIAQLCLPRRYAGFDFTPPTELAANAALLSAAALAQRALAGGPVGFSPTTGPSADALLPCLAAVRTTAPDLFPVPASAATDPLACLSPSLQHAYNQHAAAVAWRALLARFPDSADDDAQRHRNRLLSSQDSLGGFVFDSMPTRARLFIPSGDFVSFAQFRLGLQMGPHLQANAVCPCPRRAGHDHAMFCPLVSGCQTLRHDDSAGVWRRFHQQAGVSTWMEPNMQALGRVPSSGDRPAARGDLHAAHADGAVVQDFSFVHPCADSYLRVGSTAGGAAKLREQQKRSSYGALEQHPYAFVPTIVESYGRMGPAAEAYLGKLADLVADCRPSGRAHARGAFILAFRRELAASLARSTGRLFRASLQVRARASGKEFKSGFQAPSNQPVED